MINSHLDILISRYNNHRKPQPFPVALKKQEICHYSCTLVHNIPNTTQAANVLNILGGMLLQGSCFTRSISA